MDDVKVRLSDGRVVVRYRIVGTRELVYSCWEPTHFLAGPHATVMAIEGSWYGRVGSTRPPPSLLAELPVGSEERRSAVDAHYGLQNAAAYRAIRGAFPEAVNGKETSLGEITLVLPSTWRPPLVPFPAVRA